MCLLRWVRNIAVSTTGTPVCLTCCAIILLSLPSGFTLSQEQSHPHSPVFKDYKTIRPAPLIEQSDVTYQLWQVFMLERKANAGDVLAQHELGLRYLMGRGVGADTVRGAQWIEKAAGQNLIPARFNLGILLYNGWGVPWNPFDSYRQFLFAAGKGMKESQYVLSQFLTDNLVVPRNIPEAYRWLKLAADSGYAPAQGMLKDFEKNQLPPTDSTGPVIRKDSSTSLHAQLVFLDFDRDTSSGTNDQVLLKEALRSGGEEVQKALGLRKLVEDSLDVDSASIAAIRKAGEEGSPEALAVLGRCYERGVRVTKDPVTAALCYIRAIRLDSPRGSELLWRLLQDAKDVSGAEGFFRLLKSRGAQGDPDARCVWASLRALGYDGFLVNADAWLADDQALQFLQHSSDRGHLPSMIELGLCFYAGRWTNQDESAAVRMWTRAAQLGSSEARVRLAIMKVRKGGEPGDALTTLMNASRSGSILAEVALAYCYEHGVGVGVKKGQAASLYRSAAQRGSQDAFRSLKRMYDELRPPDKSFQVQD